MALNPLVVPGSPEVPSPLAAPDPLPVSNTEVLHYHRSKTRRWSRFLPPYHTRFSHFTQVAERKTRNKTALSSQNRQSWQSQPSFRISPPNWQSVAVTLGIPALKSAAKMTHPSNFTMPVRRSENRVLRVVLLVRFVPVIHSRTGFSAPILSKASKESKEAVCFLRREM